MIRDGLTMALYPIETGSVGLRDSVEPRPLDRAEFERLYELYAPALCSYVRRCLGSGGDATDLVHDAFLKLLDRPLPRMDDRGLKSYLYKIATSLLHDRWRKCAREQRWRMLFPFAQYRSSPGQSGGELNAAWSDLKPRERALLWLAYVEGYEHREIATMLNIAENSVRVLLFRARRKMASRLVALGSLPEVDQ